MGSDNGLPYHFPRDEGALMAVEAVVSLGGTADTHQIMQAIRQAKGFSRKWMNGRTNRWCQHAIDLKLLHLYAPASGSIPAIYTADSKKSAKANDIPVAVRRRENGTKDTRKGKRRTRTVKKVRTGATPAAGGTLDADLGKLHNDAQQIAERHGCIIAFTVERKAVETFTTQ